MPFAIIGVAAPAPVETGGVDHIPVSIVDGTVSRTVDRIFGMAVEVAAQNPVLRSRDGYPVVTNNLDLIALGSHMGIGRNRRISRNFDQFGPCAGGRQAIDPKIGCIQIAVDAFRTLSTESLRVWTGGDPSPKH